MRPRLLVGARHCPRRGPVGLRVRFRCCTQHSGHARPRPSLPWGPVVTVLVSPGLSGKSRAAFQWGLSVTGGRGLSQEAGLDWWQSSGLLGVLVGGSPVRQYRRPGLRSLFLPVLPAVQEAVRMARTAAPWSRAQQPCLWEMAGVRHRASHSKWAIPTLPRLLGVNGCPWSSRLVGST